MDRAKSQIAMPEKKTNPTRFLAIASPSMDSAYLSVTTQDGITVRYDLEYTQLKLLSIESTLKLGNWPVEPAAAA
jgi:hypothetical protein